MSALQTPLERWKAALRGAREASYWPGPWTIRPGEGRDDQVVGRDDDAVGIAYFVRDTNLVVLSGDSGVGKSTLLQVKVIPELRDRQDFVVFDYGYGARRSWEDTRTDAMKQDGVAGTTAFLAERLEVVARGFSATDFVDELDVRYGRRAVIVLDQFEELIRNKPDLFDALCAWVEDVVDRSRVRIVLSLRAEYVNRLRTLATGPYQRVDVTLEPLREREQIREVIESGRNRSEAAAGREVITDEATAMLTELWMEAGANQQSGRVGLLHLQAALYVLWSEIDRGAVVTPADVQDLVAKADSTLADDHSRESDAASSAARDIAQGFFQWALAEVVSLHLDRSADQVRPLVPGWQNRQVLEEGVRSVLVRMAEYLSSGGYKVDLDQDELATQVLRDELDTLGFSGARAVEARVLLREFVALTRDDAVDWLLAPRRDLVRRAKSNSSGVSTRAAGVLMGLDHRSVLFEELRRYYFALEWLEAGDIIRRSPYGAGSQMIALSHDGLGRGLNAWAASNANRPEAATTRLTAAVGKVFEWPRSAGPGSDNPFDGSSEPDGHRLAPNVRWLSSRVLRAHFRNFVFVNGDFRGTSFEHCTFDGVTFVNCLLDGAQFEACTIVGHVEPLVDDYRVKPVGLPGFAIDSPGDVEALIHYRDLDTPVAGTVLYSETSGVAARPEARDSEDVARAIFWKPEIGGLTMDGGRISSVAFQSCAFVDADAGAGVALRRVAGTSLDFVEQGDANIELFHVTIRGVTVTPSVLVTSALPHAQARPRIRVRADDCHLENVWFSAGLEGNVTIVDSRVWQLFNGSDPSSDGLTITLDESPWLGVVTKVHAGAGHQRLEKPSEDLEDVGLLPDLLGTIRDRASNIDYRSRAIDQRLTELRRAAGRIVEPSG